MNSRCPYLRGQCDEACFELGLDTVTKQTVFNGLQKIGRKPITYENDLPIKNREGIYIIKSGKLCGGYYCQKRHSKPWGVKEGGDTGHIRAWRGKMFCSSRESLGFTNLVESADTFEKAWAGVCSSILVKPKMVCYYHSSCLGLHVTLVDFQMEYGPP